MPKHAVLERPDHVDRHAILEAVLADDDLFLQELVGYEILGPANHAGYGLAGFTTSGDGTLGRTKIQAHVEDTIFPRS